MIQTSNQSGLLLLNSNNGITPSAVVASVSDSVIKLRLMEFYIVSEEHSGLLTLREI